MSADSTSVKICSPGNTEESSLEDTKISMLKMVKCTLKNRHHLTIILGWCKIKWVNLFFKWLKSSYWNRKKIGNSNGQLVPTKWRTVIGSYNWKSY